VLTADAEGKAEGGRVVADGGFFLNPVGCALAAPRNAAPLRAAECKALCGERTTYMAGLAHTTVNSSKK
jgi:hypothetical protein